MHATRTRAVVAAAGVVTAGVVGLATPAHAATDASRPTHLGAARADWVQGSKVSAAQENRWLIKAGRHLATYGARYATQRRQLVTLESIPLTDTTAAQRVTATNVTRSLNVFFRTPGLYGVAPQTHLAAARADWIRSFEVSAAESHGWLAKAQSHLATYGDRYAHQRRDLAELRAIPLTDTTATQRAAAARLTRELDAFFHTTHR